MLRDEPIDVSTKGQLACRILLIEDDPEQAAALKDALARHHYAVSIARDGGQAQAAFTMRQPDVVILDLMLPGESGFEICERLKQTNDAVPILVLTVIDLPDARELAERVGADAYLVKPIDPEELPAKIEEAAARAWERRHSAKRPREEGRVRFRCRCGKQFKVSPVHRGKALTCPECGEPVQVPRHD
ncbi:MAG: response regulator [Planctomycetaceae bacterium]